MQKFKDFEGLNSDSSNLNIFCLLHTDIDECKENKDNCVDNEFGGRCKDTIGSFTCRCIKGYTGDGVKGQGGCKGWSKDLKQSI